VQFYLRDLDTLTELMADPEFQALQAEEEPWVSGIHAVLSIGWVEVYVQDGKVVHVGADGRPTYPGFEIMSEFS
jgi:hypothetical protein